MTDRELITGLRNGSPDVFKQMIEQYQVPLVRLCKGFLHHEDDSRDIVQETFIEVFESIHRFRADSKFSTWIYRIAVNKSLNFLRKKRLQRLFVNLDMISDLRDNPSESRLYDNLNDHSDTPIEQREKKQVIRKALNTLPKNQRIAFILNKYQMLSYSETAEVMEISVSSVESLIHRAKINLQKALYHLYKNNLL